MLNQSQVIDMQLQV